MKTKTISIIADFLGWVVWLCILAGLVLVGLAFLWLCGSAAGFIYVLLRSGFTFALHQLS